MTTNPRPLQSIRKNRVEKSDVSSKSGQYTDIEQIEKEIEWAKTIFKRNPLWPVLDTTHISLEEITSEILKFLEMRMRNLKKYTLRFQK